MTSIYESLLNLWDDFKWILYPSFLCVLMTISLALAFYFHWVLIPLFLSPHALILLWRKHGRELRNWLKNRDGWFTKRRRRG